MSDVLVFGGSGYSGQELIRWLLRHPSRLVGASSDRWMGEPIRLRLPDAPPALAFRSHADLLRDAEADQVALLATPAESSLQLAPALLAKGCRVIDLSGAFRLAGPDYPLWYGFEHTAPDWLERACYGLPELFPRWDDGIRLVANPGCYATAALVASGPLIRAGLVTGPLFLDGKSGTTGAGRKADDALSFSEVAENLRPYRVGRHQHTPEIELGLGRLTTVPVTVHFVPHLIPMARGLMVTMFAAAAPDATQDRLQEVLHEAYDAAPLIDVVQSEPQTATVRDTPYTQVFARLDERTRSIHATSTLDNLIKGAAGQAIQNLNRMLGLPLETGLARAHR